MTPREVLIRWIEDGSDFPYDAPSNFADGVIAALKANGLFIGPLRSTADMDLVAHLEPQQACDAWAEMVAEWQRGEGA